MGEREPLRETIGRGELLYLGHPGNEGVFSGYGLTTESDGQEHLVGLLMIDRPRPADPSWLQDIADAYGDFQLVPMTARGERGLVCRMSIDPDSRQYLHQAPSNQSDAIQSALQPLLDEPPAPELRLRWDAESHLWRSEFEYESELPPEVKQLFERTGYGCLALESNIGVVHACYAPDSDIEGFLNKPVWQQWQLIQMPTAPLIRLELRIMDQPGSPFSFESFLNVAAEDQAAILTQLAGQEQIYLAFYGGDLSYRYTKAIPHTEEQWQHLDEIVQQAQAYWQQLPPDERDFDSAKAAYMRHPVQDQAGMSLAELATLLALPNLAGKEVETMSDQNLSQTIRAGSNTYFFDVKETKEGKPFLAVTQSRFKGEGKGHERSSVIVFPESAEEVLATFQEMISRIS